VFSHPFSLVFILTGGGDSGACHRRRRSLPSFSLLACSSFSLRCYFSSPKLTLSPAEVVVVRMVWNNDGGGGIATLL
ncbi:hypothetical protein A2U01_0062709, partial [Trifolium medium]|nr:hypothetical protein [Trifolium medium]